MISIEDFHKIELKIGRIIAAESVDGSEKLLKLSVDMGDKDEEGNASPRQVVSGIAKTYQPEQLVGRLAVFVANLESRKLMGLESNGMIVAANTGDSIALLTPDKEVPAGISLS